MSNSLQPHGLQHSRLPAHHEFPELTQTHCPSSRWCHPTNSFSAILFSCLQSFPASGSFPMSQFLASGGQSIGVSGSTSVLTMKIQDWFPLGWTGWIAFQSKGFSRVFSNTTVQKHHSLTLNFLYSPTLTFICDYWKPIALTIQIFIGKVISLFFNMLSRFGHNISSKGQASFHFMASVTICSDFEAPK